MDIVTLNPARSKMAVPNTGGKYPISFIINDETSGSGELYDFAVIFLVCSNLCIGSELLIIGKYTTPKLLLNSIGPFLVRSNPRKLTHKTVCMSFCLLLPLLEAYAYSADETQENKISLIEVLVFLLIAFNKFKSISLGDHRALIGVEIMGVLALKIETGSAGNNRNLFMLPMIANTLRNNGNFDH